MPLAITPRLLNVQSTVMPAFLAVQRELTDETPPGV